MINAYLETSTVLTVALVGALITITVLIIFGLNAYQIKQRRTYSFKNEFPFELTQGVGLNFIPYIHAMALLFTTAMILFGFYAIKYHGYFAGPSFLVSWTITAFLIYLLFIIKFSSVKRHLLVSASMLVFTMINAVMFGLYLQFSPIFTQNLLFPIISYGLGFVALLLAVNPRLNKWSVSDKIEQQDGTVIMLRPKVYVLAMTEWVLILLNVLIMVNAYLSIFIA